MQEHGWCAPAYWNLRDGSHHEFSLAGLSPLHPDAPVLHISFYEADAFARWRAQHEPGLRLPTELEWEHAAAQQGITDARAHVLDNAAHNTASDGPLYQLTGAAWQWTGSAYRPYPGYRPPAGALGEYNGKFMVSQHVLRGGSLATPPGHTRVTYRNFFHPSARWQYAGIRLARDAR